MLNLKKVIASICVIAMVLTTVAFGATYTDVAEDSVYYEAVETLTKLDIVEGFDGEYRPEDGVTRAEMAALIARIQGYGETAKGAANTAFTDVPSSHWASGYIANAAGMGIINGYGDGTFGPEDPVLYEQAIKMVMATLGYTPYAEKNGGYPTGYLAAAQRYDVSLAVANAAVGQAANRGTVAQILVNALDTSLMVQSYWNTNGEVGYEIADGIDGRAYRTLMSENLGYVKIRGIVKANTTTVLGASANINTDKDATVVINVRDAYKTTNKDFEDVNGGTAEDFEILVAGTDVEEYIGRSVIGYIKKLATDKYEMVSVAVDTARNDELVINLADYANVTSNEINYYKDGANKTTAAALEKKADGSYDATLINVIFNGSGADSTGTAYDASDIASIVEVAGAAPLKVGGKMTLIDNDTTKGYDVVIIDLAATAVVKEVGNRGIELYNEAVIAGDYSEATDMIRVNVEDETKVVKIYKDGEEIAYTDLVEWDVLSVYAIDKTADYIVAEVISDEVTGTIISTKKDETSASTAVANTAYKVGDNFYAVALGAYDEGLDIGAGGKFYIDQFGKIAAFIEDAALAGGVAGNYAYVMGLEDTKKTFGSSADIEIAVQLLTEDGVEVVKVKNNAKFYPADTTGSGVTLNINDWVWTDAGSDDVYLRTELDATGQSLLGQLDAIDNKIIKFTKDSNGNLASITMSGYKASASATAAFKADASVLGANNPFDAESFRFTGSGKKFWLAADAKVFVAGDESTSKVVTAADLVDKAGYDILGAYTTKSADECDMVVVSDTSFIGISETMNLAVVTGIANITNDAGAEVLLITFLQNGEEMTLETTEDAPTSGISEGDIIQIKTAGDKIANIVYVVDFADEGVRDLEDNTIAVNEQKYYDKTYASMGDEKIYGGYVTAWNRNAKLATIFNVEYDNNGVSAGGVVGETIADVKLSNAQNVYTIDNTGAKLIIEDGGSFTALSNILYNDEVSLVTVKDERDSQKISAAAENITKEAAVAYGDWVYVREYEGKVVDVVIVKAADYLYVDEVATVVVSFDGVTPTTGEMDDVLVVKGETLTLPANVFTKTGYTFGGWDTDASADTQVYADQATTSALNNDVTLYAKWNSAS